MNRRAALDCPHRPPCPGCPRFGEPGVAPDALAALGQLADEAGIAPPRTRQGMAFGWRHRARLAVRGRARSPKVGLFQSDSHRIVDIPRCAVHHPLINDIAAAVKHAIRSTDTEPYADRPHRGLLRYLQVVVERSSQTAQVVLVCNDDDPASCMPLAEQLQDGLGDALHSLWWNGNPERGNTILGAHWRRLRGPATVCEEIGGARIHFPPGAFGQANLALADTMVERIGAWVPEGAVVADVYAGCGAIGIPLLRRARAIHFVERGEDSLRGLRLSIAEHSPELRERIQIHSGAAGEQADLLREVGSYDVVIVDPPRRGVDAPLLRALSATPPARLVYASCGLPSFLHEARALLASDALRLRALEAYALFPNTEHVETLALFERA